jgi:hypothetical protein
MIRQLVQSSSLRVVGYDNDTKVLEIGFVKGGVYRYFEVPELVYLSLSVLIQRVLTFMNISEGIIDTSTPANQKDERNDYVLRSI